MNSNTNIELLKQIQDLKAEHPYWGYRRVWAYLKYNKGFNVNHKRIHRLMKTHNLLVPKNLKLRAKREVKTHKPRTKKPNHYWGIDMTKVMPTNQGWAYVHVVIDWGSKKLLPPMQAKTANQRTGKSH